VDTRDCKREAALLLGHDDREVYRLRRQILMSLIGHLFAIVIGLLLACFAAGMVIVMAILFPDWSDMALGPVDPDAINVLFVFGFIFVSGFALIPALLVVLVTETFSIRSALTYAVGGALTGLACYLGLVPFDPHTMSFDGIVRRHLEIMMGAGVVAGAVYWLIAGRKAGLWRNPLAPQAPPAPPPA
jgi:hypothetical protein